MQAHISSRFNAARRISSRFNAAHKNAARQARTTATCRSHCPLMNSPPSWSAPGRRRRAGFVRDAAASSHPGYASCSWNRLWLVRPMLDKFLRLFSGELKWIFVRKSRSLILGFCSLRSSYLPPGAKRLQGGCTRLPTFIGEFNSARPQRGARATFELLERMQRCGVSRYHPDPVSACVEAERAAATQEKPREGTGGT